MFVMFVHEFRQLKNLLYSYTQEIGAKNKAAEVKLTQ
jgi:hypothetical protein